MGQIILSVALILTAAAAAIAPAVARPMDRPPEHVKIDHHPHSVTDAIVHIPDAQHHVWLYNFNTDKGASTHINMEHLKNPGNHVVHIMKYPDHHGEHGAPTITTTLPKDPPSGTNIEFRYHKSESRNGEHSDSESE